MPVVLVHAIKDSTNIFGISGVFEPPKPLPLLSTPLTDILLLL